MVGADGPVSKVASCLGFPKNKELIPAVTVQAEGEFDPIMEMHFGGVAPGAYAWVLPKRSGANIGTGISPKYSEGKATDHLQRFVEARGIKVHGRVTGKYVPSKGPINRTYTETSLLVGDAAGHVMAVNGGGIRSR